MERASGGGEAEVCEGLLCVAGAEVVFARSPHSVVQRISQRTGHSFSKRSFAVVFFVLFQLEDGEPDYWRSAFILYAIDHWLESVVWNPELSRNEVMKMLEDKWKGLSAEEKKPYERAEKKDKKRYVKEMQKAHPEWV